MTLADDIRHEILFVNAEKIRLLGACSDPREKMTAQFPDGVEITVELCEEHAKDYDFYWAANHFLKGSDLEHWRTEYTHLEKTHGRAFDQLYSLHHESGVLSQEEHSRLYLVNRDLQFKKMGTLFGNAMLKKAERAANALARRLKTLNDDELRYKVLFLTPERLEALGACSRGVEKFRDKFGNEGTEITKELALLHRNDFEWDAAANLLLNDTARIEYNVLADAAYVNSRKVAKLAWTQRDAGELTEWQSNGIQQLAQFNYAGDLAVAFATAIIHQYEALKNQLDEEKSTEDQLEEVIDQDAPSENKENANAEDFPNEETTGW